jgi:hypothetical protein
LPLLLSVVSITLPVPCTASELLTDIVPEGDSVSEIPLVKLVDPPSSAVELPALTDTLPPDSALPAFTAMLFGDTDAADEPEIISILPEFRSDLESPDESTTSPES